MAKTYLVSLKDLKFLVGNLENYEINRKDAVDWIRDHKKIINPVFMEQVYIFPRDILSHIYQDIIRVKNVRNLEKEGVEIVSIY